MTRGDGLRLLLIYAAALIGGSILFVALFHTATFATMTVFFYRGIALLLLATVVVTALLVIVRQARYRRLIGVRDVILIASLLFSANIVFFTHLPVTADRSISVFMLGYLNETGSELTRDEITDVIVQRYVGQNDAIGKRLDEQVVSGDLVRTGDRYRISDQGRRLMDLYKVIAGLFNLDTGNVAP